MHLQQIGRAVIARARFLFKQGFFNETRKTYQTSNNYRSATLAMNMIWSNNFVVLVLVLFVLHALKIARAFDFFNFLHFSFETKKTRYLHVESNKFQFDFLIVIHCNCSTIC